MLRQKLINASRSYAVYTKRAAFIKTSSPAIKKKVVSSTYNKTATPTPASTAAEQAAIPTQELPPFLEPDQFNPPEFALQTGQTSHSPPPIAEPEPEIKTHGLKSQTLTEVYKSTLNDLPHPPVPTAPVTDIHWPESYHGLGAEPFSERIAEILAEKINPQDIEIKPDGLIYLPEIKYRRILNRSFGPGGWGMVPRSETLVTPSLITREYALVCFGRLVSIARGEQDYFSQDGIPTATEGCRSNALMRCCKDLGIASELWDPVFIRQFKKDHCEERFVEHMTNKRKRKVWKRKDRNVEYPYKLI